jgi:2-oxoglutarate ferredoxin oxidoreductase subunit delta
MKGTVHIESDRCKGCSLCIGVCPQHVLALDFNTRNPRGYHPAQVVENPAGKGCTGCEVCALICPDSCITVLRESCPIHQTSEA